MKKKRFLAVILIASSTLFGVGYSWWTEGLQINGQVSTGSLKVVPADKSISLEDSDNEDKMKTEDIGNGNKGFSYTIKDLYPNRSYRFTAAFENQGTLPAKVAEVVIISKEVEGEGEEYTKELLGHLKVTGKVKVAARSGNTYIQVENYVRDFGETNITLENLQEYLNNEIVNWKLEEAQSIIFEDCNIRFINAGREGNKNYGEGKTIKVNLAILFKQHNQE